MTLRNVATERIDDDESAAYIRPAATSFLRFLI